MLDVSYARSFDGPNSIVERDAMTIARLPELIEKLEETAYALVRQGETETGNALFVAVAAIERSDESENSLAAR